MRWLLLIILPIYASAGEVFVSYGLGVAGSAYTSPTEVKVLNLGQRFDIWKGVYAQYKLGYWGDGSGDSSRHASGYGSAGLGITIALSPVEIRSGWGLGGITTTDSYLGGHFPQFNGEFYVGIRDKNGNGIGAQYEHVSSAGIVIPNEGRDFVVIQVSKHW